MPQSSIWQLDEDRPRKYSQSWDRESLTIILPIALDYWKVYRYHLKSRHYRKLNITLSIRSTCFKFKGPWNKIITYICDIYICIKPSIGLLNATEYSVRFIYSLGIQSKIQPLGTQENPTTWEYNLVGLLSQTNQC